MATINVKDAAGSTVALEKPLTPGQAAMAASRPVVLASDQSSIPVAATLAAETTKVIGTVRTASGGIASGSVASGAVASGAYAAGSLAAGAGVDGWDLTQGAIADAAVTAGATGSISAKLRSLSRDIGSLVTAIGSTAWDLGSGTGGTRTQRVTVDTGQLAALNTTAQAMSAGFQLVSLPTDSTLPGGPVAHDAVDSGNGHKQAAKATTALSALTLVSSADRTDLFAGVDGVQIIRPHCNLEDIVSGRATDTAGSSTSCIASSGAGVKTYLTSVALTNSSATAVTVNILDGVTVKYTLSVPAGSGNNKEFTVPLPGTAATAWNFQSSAAATTITCSMIGFKSKV